MGDSRYPDLKSTLSPISVKALNCRTRLLLAYHLDSTDPLPSEKGFARDYRGLAEQIGFLYHDIRMLEEHENRTKRVLESWEIREGATLDKLITYLEDMERHDIIEEIIPSLMENVENYIAFQQSLENAEQDDEVSSDTVHLHIKEQPLTSNDGPKTMCGLRRIYVILIILTIAITLITTTIIIIIKVKAEQFANQQASKSFNDITSLFKSSLNNKPNFKPDLNDQPKFTPNYQPYFKPTWKFQ